MLEILVLQIYQEADDGWDFFPGIVVPQPWGSCYWLEMKMTTPQINCSTSNVCQQQCGQSWNPEKKHHFSNHQIFYWSQTVKNKRRVLKLFFHLQLVGVQFVLWSMKHFLRVCKRSVIVPKPKQTHLLCCFCVIKVEWIKSPMTCKTVSS